MGNRSSSLLRGNMWDDLEKLKVKFRNLSKRFSEISAQNKELQEKNLELHDKNRELRKENIKLFQEKEHVLKSATKLVFDLHCMQEQMETWNREDGTFFDRIMPMLQILHGCLEAGDRTAAERTLYSLKEQILNSRRMLYKNKQVSFEEWIGKRLDADDIDGALRSFESRMDESGKSVLYQNLLLPTLCILVGNSSDNFDGELMKEIDEILQSEGLKALYYDELEPDDTSSRSGFVVVNTGMQTPGIFWDKKEDGYKLFGNYQGRIPKENTKEKI